MRPDLEAMLVQIDAVAHAAARALDRLPYLDDPVQRANLRPLDGLVTTLADLAAKALDRAEGSDVA